MRLFGNFKLVLIAIRQVLLLPPHLNLLENRRCLAQFQVAEFRSSKFLGEKRKKSQFVLSYEQA